MSNPPVLNPFNVSIYPAPEPYQGNETMSEVNQEQPEAEIQNPQMTEGGTFEGDSIAVEEEECEELLNELLDDDDDDGDGDDEDEDLED